MRASIQFAVCALVGLAASPAAFAVPIRIHSSDTLYGHGPQGVGVAPAGQGIGVVPRRHVGLSRDTTGASVAPSGQGAGAAPDAQGAEIAPDKNGAGVALDGKGASVVPDGQGQGAGVDGKATGVAPDAQGAGVAPHGHGQDAGISHGLRPGLHRIGNAIEFFLHPSRALRSRDSASDVRRAAFDFNNPKDCNPGLVFRLPNDAFNAEVPNSHGSRNLNSVFHCW